MPKQSRLEIVGEQIALRPLDVSMSLDDYLSWANDEETTRYLALTPPVSREDLLGYIGTFEGTEDRYLFGMFLLDTGQHVGNITLQGIDRSHGRAETGLLVGEASAQGRGIGTEAIGLVCRFAFEDLGLHRVQAGVVEGNIGSERAFQKNGFAKEGCLRDEFLLDGQYRDAIRFGILADEWSTGKA